MTNAEYERVAMLAEEAAEIVHACMKILRHGFESYHPDRPEWTNRMQLCKEINQLFAVVIMMEGDIDPTIGEDTQEMIERMLRWTHHQEIGGKTDAAL